MNGEYRDKSMAGAEVVYRRGGSRAEHVGCCVSLDFIGTELGSQWSVFSRRETQPA